MEEQRPIAARAVASIGSLKARLDQAAADEHQLRVLLWSTHPCAGKYGDDGELQCNQCRIDFLRLPVAELAGELARPSLEWLELAQWQTCKHCGVTRFTHDAVAPCRAGAHQWQRSPEEIAREDRLLFGRAAERLQSRYGTTRIRRVVARFLAAALHELARGLG